MHVDLTPLVADVLPVLVPSLALFLIHLAVRPLQPALVNYLGEAQAAALQTRVDALLDKAIGFGVAKAVAAIDARGVGVNVKSQVVKTALEYATSHAPDLALQAGQLEEKVLARYASHPAVQQLAVTAPANPPGAIVETSPDAAPAPAKAA